MLLENMSYLEVETYLKKMDSILIPIGSVEQHSPYGLIGTDFITAQEIARKTGEAMDLCVAPTVTYGSSAHHMAFKGTVTLSPATFIAMVSDIATSLFQHGFHKIIFINGHGGNIHPIHTAFQILKANGFMGILHLISWYELFDVRALVAELYGDHEGQHATPSEVSVTRFFRPDHFENKVKVEAKDKEVDFVWPLNSEEMQAFFPDGRIFSSPWLATEKDGEKITAVSVSALRSELEKIIL